MRQTFLPTGFILFAFVVVASAYTDPHPAAESESKFTIHAARKLDPEQL